MDSKIAIDLRDWPGVIAANWATFLGAKFTAGSTQISNTPWTAADVGKIAMVLVNNATMQWWMTSIVSVANGVATVSSVAPAAGSNENTAARVRYGFDGSTAINAALNEIQADTDGPVDVFLGGNYRLTQLTVPPNVVLHGVPWKNSVVQNQANLSKTSLAQLPGAERDFVIFTSWPGSAIPGYITGCGITDLELLGPETNVVGVATATKGNGVSFRAEGLDSGWIIDGFQIRNVSSSNFPESGFKCFDSCPMYLNECKALCNGRYGYEHVATFGGFSTNALHILNFSADWNNLGALGFRGLGVNDSVFITGVKSEGIATGPEADLATRAAPGYQSNCVTFDNCDNTVAMVNGVSHVRVSRASIGPGPAITISDSTGAGKKPRLTFNGVMERVGGWETAGTTGDAVTLRDVISNVDIPRAVTAGIYPGQTAVPESSTAPGTAGDLAYDAEFFYICVATSTWRRIDIADW